MLEYIENLKKIGLTQYEAKAYYALLQKKTFSAAELSQLSEVPRTRIYGILDSLTSKGIVIQIPGKVKHFKAVNPKFAFDGLLEDLQEKTELKKNRIKHISKALIPMYEKENHKTTALDYIEVIKEKPRIAERLNELEDNAIEEIITMNKAPYLANVAEISKQGLREKSKSVTYRFLAGKEDLLSSNYCKFLDKWEEIGAIIKIAPDIPIKMLIFDNKTTVINIPDPVSTKDNFTTLIIESPQLVQFYRKIFDVYFEEAIDYTEFKKINNQ